MKVCYTGGAVKDCGSYYSVATNAVELRIWFLTDDILRIRAGFDGDWDEASYSLTMTAWESRTDELMKDCRKRVQSAAASLTDGDRQAVIQGARLKVVIEKAPFRIMVYDKDGSLLHADIPDLAYREDSNHRRIHASQIEADDCFYGFGEKSGEINKAEKYMNMAPGDAMGYNAKETDSLYKHIPFYIRLNRGTKQAVGYFYHNTAECDFNMGREKRNYWHRYSSYRTDAGDIDLFLIAGPSIREIIERYTDLTGKIGPSYSGSAQEESMIIYNESVGASGNRMVGYLYASGISLEFYIASDMDVDDATIDVSITGEFVTMSYDGNDYQVIVNGEAKSYPRVTIEATQSSMPQCADLISIKGVHLNKGANLIQLMTNNTNEVDGTTFKAYAPIVDCVKVTTEAVLIWDENHNEPATGNYQK